MGFEKIATTLDLNDRDLLQEGQTLIQMPDPRICFEWRHFSHRATVTWVRRLIVKRKGKEVTVSNLTSADAVACPG
jgi:hypothetical protein